MSKRKLRPSEIAKRLEAMVANWPDGYSLFAASDSLLLYETETGRVCDSISLPCDDGDPKMHYDNEGNEYIEF